MWMNIRRSFKSAVSIGRYEVSINVIASKNG